MESSIAAIGKVFIGKAMYVEYLRLHIIAYSACIIPARSCIAAIELTTLKRGKPSKADETINKSLINTEISQKEEFNEVLKRNTNILESFEEFAREQERRQSRKCNDHKKWSLDEKILETLEIASGLLEIHRSEGSLDKLSEVKESLRQNISKVKTRLKIHIEKPRNKPVSILLVSGYMPTSRHAGGLRVLDIYRTLRKNFDNLRIDLFSTSRPDIDGESCLGEARLLFDTVFLSEDSELSAKRLIKRKKDKRPLNYDVIDIQFWNMKYNIDEYRLLGKKVIYTPMESHVRNITENFDIYLEGAETAGSRIGSLTLDELIECCDGELDACTQADAIITVSHADKRAIKRLLPSLQVIALETCLGEDITQKNAFLHQATIENRFKERRVGYLAYFGSETNIEALKWYLSDVHPKLTSTLPDYRFSIIGSGDISSVRELLDDRVDYIGSFDDLSESLANIAIGIAPVLSGGGFRGKINQYSYFWIPTITHHSATKGLPYKHGKDILLGSNGLEYAENIRFLLGDFDAYRDITSKANATANKKYTWDSRIKELAKIYEIANIGQSLGENPLVSAVVTSYMHNEYLEKRIRSIYEQSYKNFECIVIDDCSTDGSDERLQELQKKFGFRYIRMNVNSGSAFGTWKTGLDQSKGELIWICESDDYADKEFLAKGVSFIKSLNGASLFYSASTFVNENNERIGTTHDYHKNVWNSSRWNDDFFNAGEDELENYQILGQTVPNMSSALITRNSFELALEESLKKFRLCGDWLFAGLVMRQGIVCYCSKPLSYFRKHAQTQTAITPLARSIAEYIVVKYRLMGRIGGDRTLEMRDSLTKDAIRAIHSDANFMDILKELFYLAESQKEASYIMHSTWGTISESQQHVDDLSSRYKTFRLRQ